MTEPSGAADDFVQVGEVHGAFGVRGALKVRSLCRPPEGLFNYTRWYLGREDAGLPVSVVTFRPDGENFIVQLAGITSREQAEGLLGSRVSVPASELPAPEPGVFYWRDLIGLKVQTTEQIELGVVGRMAETGSADVLVVDGERQRLIPFVIPRYVVSVDLAKGVIVVDWHPDD